MSSRKNDLEKFVVRFSEVGLRSQIATRAKQTNRSMNAEIIHRLFHGFELEEELRRANAVIDHLTGSEESTEEFPVPRRVSNGG
ncbi:Arc family DNA-binding protein [Pseudomonas sp. NA-150]|uniref:Arc family DNA-binding protein n=1 Tax=Pseudomonas sp. NA-150 TaxID=3367525 RepID=UPI0037C850A8